ncbi:D-alanyl-D-alanine carboxypeptidase/D-alanyl-D-alanine-endopeptidase, partial [Vibrio parahaemolyticus V-223/04]
NEKSRCLSNLRFKILNVIPVKISVRYSSN